MTRKHLIRRYFITGLLIWVPLVITLWVLDLLVSTMDRTLQLLPPQWRTEGWLGVHIPGLGHCTSSALRNACPPGANRVSLIFFTPV